MVLDLASEVTGAGAPFVVMHGLFGSSRNWGAIARQVGDLRQVHAVDLRNHGASPWDDATDYAAMAGDVAHYIEQRGLGPADVMGHSMGGKAAMMLALTRPDLVRRLIIVDIAPVTYKPDVYPGYIEAMRGADLAHERRGEVEAELIPGVPDAGLRAFLGQNLIRDGKGFRWRLNLDALAAGLDDILGWPKQQGGHFDGPTEVLLGGKSAYVRPQDRLGMQALFPAARFETVEGAGHWAHAEQPERFLALLRRALA
ncbi:MAG: alpha/beta fold hydrolase [Rhodospirillaceae bacterium]|nr:alpha/beta fold hydrolase [Rhodospirillaceae bacterium]